jgi:hypothetical protein
MTKSPPIDAFCPVVRQDRDDRGEAPGQEMHAAAGVRARRPFTIGQELRARGACWRVQQIQPYPACRVVLLAPLRNNAHPPIALIAPFDRLTAVSRVERWRGCGLQCLVARLAAAVRDTVTGGAGNLIKPDLSLVPWQWAAATALLRGEASVLLLADVVGLGKTIQAALAIAALRARGDAGRVLILAPAGLREQWQSELERLFRFRCSIVDAPWLRSARREMPPSVNPWTVVSTAIASVDFVKQPEVLAAAAGAPWDVLVVDEAHALGARTDRRVAAAALASCARHVLLLTATPHAGSHDEFAALCRVGTLPGDPAQTLGIRRTRPDVGVDGARRVWVARLVLTGAERRMHALLRSYASAVWHARGRRPPTARLAMTVLLKRGASSAWALHCSVRERLRCSTTRRSLQASRRFRSMIPARRTMMTRPCRAYSGSPDSMSVSASCRFSPSCARPRTPLLRARASSPAWPPCSGALASRPSCSRSTSTRSMPRRAR